MFSHMLGVCDSCSFLQLHQLFWFITWVPLPSYFHFPHTDLSGRYVGGMVACLLSPLEELLHTNTVHLLETSLQVLTAYQKANSVADTFACQRMFYHPTFTIMCRVVSAGSRRCKQHTTKQKNSFCTKKQGMGLHKSVIYIPLSTLNSYYLQPRIVFTEKECLRKHYEAEAWSDVLNVF